MGDIDWYANTVSTVAALLGGWSIAWQIKSNWWNRPNIVLEDCRVSIESEIRSAGVHSVGWAAEVTVSNTGDADTTLHSLEWEFDYGPDDRRLSVFVAGTALGDDTGAITITHEDVRAGERKATVEADEGARFEPVRLGRNDGLARLVYRIGTYPVEKYLADTVRARPVAHFVDRKDRKRRFSRKRHGIVRQNGPWTLTPSPGRQYVPPGIGTVEN